MAVMTDTSNKAYQTLFGLTPSSSNKAWKKALRKTSYGYYSNKGKSYITIQKKTIKHAPEHKFNIEGKKQTIRNILKNQVYWEHRWMIVGIPGVFDFDKAFEFKFKKINTKTATNNYNII